MVKREVGLDTYQGCSFGLSLGTDDNTFLLFECLVHYPFGPFGLIARTRTHTRMSRVSTQALSPVCCSRCMSMVVNTHSPGTSHSYESPPARAQASRITQNMDRTRCIADRTSCCATCFASTDSVWVYAFTSICACVICMNSHPCVASSKPARSVSRRRR